MSYQSLQERVVREFSDRLVGGQSVFAPALVRNGTREPADLAWVSGGCVVLLHMQGGGKPFDVKRLHNHKQLHGWMRNWKSGERLRDGKAVSLGYDDVTNVVGVSVVGGDFTASVFEPAEVAKSHAKQGDTKLATCATISDSVLERLSKRSVGVRDVLNFVAYLADCGGPVEDREALEWIEATEAKYAASARAEFAAILPSSNSLNQAWIEALAYMRALRAQPADRDSPVLSDLSVADVVWLSVAERAISEALAPPGHFGALLGKCSRRISNYEIQCIVADNLAVLNRQGVVLPNRGLAVFSSFDFGPGNPTRMIVPIEEGLVRETDELILRLREQIT